MHKRTTLYQLLLCFSSLILIGCTGLFFYPSKKGFPNNNLDSYDFSDVYFPSASGVTLHGILIKPVIKSRAAVLFFHGNAMNLDYHLYNVLWLVDEGFTVFAVDYRGYGKSTGSIDIDGVHQDAEASLEKLLVLCPEQAQKVIVFGQSLGADIAAYTVANTKYRQNVRALILDSPFSSYKELAREKLSHIIFPFNYLFYPFTFVIDDFYSAVRWVKNIDVPLLVICGTNDPVTPLDYCRKTYERAVMPKEIWMNDAPGHISFVTYVKNRRALVKYIHRWL